MVVAKCSLSVSGIASSLQLAPWRFTNYAIHRAGDVAESLTAAITQSQTSRDEERPHKRRKLSNGHESVTQDPAVSSARTPAGYVTLARLLLNFVSRPSPCDPFRVRTKLSLHRVLQNQTRSWGYPLILRRRLLCDFPSS